MSILINKTKADKSASDSLNPSIFEGLVTLCAPDAVSVSLISTILFSHTNISYNPTITGMVAIDSNVVSTYNELAYTASLSYSCAMDVTVAQAGVTDEIGRAHV